MTYLETLAARLAYISRSHVGLVGGYPDAIQVVGDRIVIASVADRCGNDNEPTLEVLTLNGAEEQIRDWVEVWEGEFPPDWETAW